MEMIKTTITPAMCEPSQRSVKLHLTIKIIVTVLTILGVWPLPLQLKKGTFVTVLWSVINFLFVVLHVASTCLVVVITYKAGKTGLTRDLPQGIISSFAAICIFVLLSKRQMLSRFLEVYGKEMGTAKNGPRGPIFLLPALMITILVVFSAALLYTGCLTGEAMVKVMGGIGNLPVFGKLFLSLGLTLTIHANMTIFFVVGLMFCLCYFLSCEFDTVATKLSRQAVEAKTFSGLKLLTMRHSTLTRVTVDFDLIFSPIVLMLFVMTLALNCLTISGTLTTLEVVQEPDDIEVAVLLWLGLEALAGFLGLVATSLSMAHINTTAHKPLLAVQEMLLAVELPHNQRHLLSAFAHKLSATRIGLTGCGFFVVDRSFLLTIAGLFLTYIVLLLQFRPQGGTAEDIKNVLGLMTNLTKR